MVIWPRFQSTNRSRDVDSWVNKIAHATLIHGSELLCPMAVLCHQRTFGTIIPNNILTRDQRNRRCMCHLCLFSISRDRDTRFVETSRNASPERVLIGQYSVRIPTFSIWTSHANWVFRGGHVFCFHGTIDNNNTCRTHCLCTHYNGNARFTRSIYVFYMYPHGSSVTHRLGTNDNILL